MFKRILILFFIAFFLAMPLVGLAQFKLQQIYPNVGGSNLGVDANGKPISASQSIPSLVRYLFNLVVWVCILVAIIVLIAGGVQYVTSSGDVGKMSGAKTRIYSSLLGLIILIGAWFVLHTMNPSLVLPRITYIPIKQGIVFFTKEGYCRFMGMGADCKGKEDVDASIINDLVQSNQAKIINNSTPSLTTVFGPLIFSSCGGSDMKLNSNGILENVDPKNTNTRLNFADFDVYTFAFWGKKAQGAKLSFYNKISYENLDEKTIPLTYDYRGLLDINGEPIKDNNDKQVVTIQTPKKIKDIIVIDPKAFGGEGGREFTLGPSDLGRHEYKTWIISGQSKNAYYFNKSEVQYLNASNYFTVDPSSDKDKLNTTGASFTQCGKRDGAIYFNLINDEEFRNSVVVASPKAILHPPMSMKIIWSSPGVYLVDANGDERYFDSSAKDLSDPSINFDQKAQDIKIINDTPERIYEDENGTHKVPGETRDFLAILHENDNFSGKLKVYFEQRMYKDSGKVYSPKAKNKLIPAYTSCGIIPTETSIKFETRLNSLFSFINYIYEGTFKTSHNLVSSLVFKNDKDGFYYWQGYGERNTGDIFNPFIFTFGHLPMIKFNEKAEIVKEGGNQKISNVESVFTQSNNDTFSVYEEARYGDIGNKAPKSVEVFELADNPNECQEVKLCTEKSGRGYCLAYVAQGQAKTNDSNTVYYPMPVYLPVPLPFAHTFTTNPSIICPDEYLPTFKDNGKDKKVEFANNIKSIIIEGKCAVVILGAMSNPSIAGSVGQALETFKILFGQVKAGPFQDEKHKNDVFTSSDYNLEDNEIGQCGSTSGFGFGKFFNQSCAAAIAVYPIK